MISLQQIREKDLILIAQWEKNQFIKNYMNVKPIMTLKLKTIYNIFITIML